MKVKELIAKLQEFDGELEAQIISGLDNDIEEVRLRKIEIRNELVEVVSLEGWTFF
jgi:hypothetical protein